jgi:hypothetical protein
MIRNALHDAPERGKNPFIYNAPVRGSDFIGRREIVEKIFTETILKKSQGDVWVTGERQVGKTSLLKYIQAGGEKLDKKINLYGVEGEFNAAFIYLNVQDISNRRDFYENLRQSLESYFEFKIELTGEAVENFIKALGFLFFDKKYYIVFLLDEFDVFIERLAADEPKGAASFLDEFNKLRQGISNLADAPKTFGCVFASQQTTGEILEKNGITMRGSEWTVELMELPFFSREETGELAEHYLKDNPVSFSKDDVDHCFKMTRGYPYFVQKMFAVIYEHKAPGAADYMRKAQREYADAFQETSRGWGYPHMRGNERSRGILSQLFQPLLDILPQSRIDTARKELPASQKQVDFYLTSVRLENILGFESLSTQLVSNGVTPLMFSLLLGDNSAGKTSFLRCLALGMCDKVSAAALLDDYQGKFIYNGHKKGTIELELNLAGRKRYRIVTRVKQIKHFEDVEKEYYSLPGNGKARRIQAKDFPWDDLFVCGYGAGRVLGETREIYEEYRIKNAVGTLFRYDQPLQDPELSLRRVISQARHNAPGHMEAETEEEILRRILFLIKNLFMFTGDERIELTGKGLEVVAAAGRSVLRAHGDGYKNTSGWVLDLIAWNMLAGRQLTPLGMSGIVLVDEIEQHLHPKWQRYIIQLLCKQFPGVQFIVATHSPLCTSSIADLDEDRHQVLRFRKAGNEPAEVARVSALRGLRADQILTSEAFDLPTTRNPEIAEKLEKFSKLYLKEPRTAGEEKEFRELGQLLEELLPGHTDTLETSLMQERVKNIMKDTTPKKQE